MLSLLGVFRAASRRDLCALPATASAMRAMSSSSSPIADPLNRDLQDVETMSQMGDVFEEMAEQQSLYEQGGDGILDIPGKSPPAP